MRNKAYACLEPDENTGGIHFAKSNIEARRYAASEYNGGELGGMSVVRAPWADKYEKASRIPISDMVNHGWHFECSWSGIRIDSDLYDEGKEIWDEESNEYVLDKSFIGKSPTGNQFGPIFACLEYEKLYKEEKEKRKVFENEQKIIYKNYVKTLLPEVKFVNDENIYGRREHIYSVKSGDVFVIDQLTIPFLFPNIKYWAALEINRDKHSKIGPLKPYFLCAKGDHEEFLKWIDRQKHMRKAS